MHLPKLISRSTLLLIFAGAIYVCFLPRADKPAHYEAVPLIQGGRSSGMPLVGIAVDPSRREVFAIVGGPKKSGADATFFIAWTGKDGETYSTTFTGGDQRPDALSHVTNGEVQTIHTFDAPTVVSKGIQSRQIATADTALRSLLTSLPNAGGPAPQR